MPDTVFRLAVERLLSQWDIKCRRSIQESKIENIIGIDTLCSGL